MALKIGAITKVDNGSRFYTCDLHLHSFGASEDVKDPTMTVQAIVDSAKQAGIGVLALTDHNSGKNIDAALEHAAQYAGELLVLPGVEVTTAHGHLLAYFAPENSENVGALLSRIGIVGKHGSRDSHTTASMADVIAEVERLKGFCIAAHMDRDDNTGFESGHTGYPNWKKDVLLSFGLLGLEMDEVDHLIWYSEEDESSDAGNERKRLLKARAKNPATVTRPRLAPVQNSDAHSLKAFTSRLTAQVLTRLKLNELSFGAVRTALLDPGARVRALATVPKSIGRIVGMFVEGGFLDGETLHFSSNLNCLIGGRGTGKSTAIQSLAYGLGIRDDLDEQDNCPDNVIVYCEGEDGVLYRYERTRGNDPVVKAWEDQARTVVDVPADAFPVEFYAQGDLAKVAENPLRHPRLLQDFLDRHLRLLDLVMKEEAFCAELAQNSAQLIPLEASAAQLTGKNSALKELDTKIKVAETGKLKALAAFQSQLAAEKGFASSLGDIAQSYRNGLSLHVVEVDYEDLAETAGQLTERDATKALFAEVADTVSKGNAFLAKQQTMVNDGLKTFATRIDQILKKLAAEHQKLDDEVRAKIAAFQKQGLSVDVTALTRIINQRSQLATEITRIKGRDADLRRLRRRRQELLSDLNAVREEKATRRKAQLGNINKHLQRTITDYSISIFYVKTGITDAFEKLVCEVMHGSHFKDEAARGLCEQLSPMQLADLVVNGDVADVEKYAGSGWGSEIIRRFGVLTELHRLEVVERAAKPVIKVLTKTATPKTIPVNQLSDGQKHTILLTIALLAESNTPLIMDQPEDDLDNAFISASVVRTLREIKERRQVILVTHNANIAVLGDSELILPMRRTGNTGEVHERGGIDRKETADVVQDILEGGALAFRKRKEIYGH